MQSIELHTRAGSDGVLHLEVPGAAANADYDILVILRPRNAQAGNGVPAPTGWMPDFFARTAGTWQGEPLVREPQGEYEVRDSLP
jgi:hypothetical protein